MKHSISARGLSTLIAAGALVAGGIAASAQPMPGQPATGSAAGGTQSRDIMPLNDAEFVRAMSAANTAELESAKYIVNRTKDASVKTFAQRMVDDHSSAAVQLSAATRGVNLAPVPAAREANLAGTMMTTQLQGLSGNELDTRYMRMQVPAHQRVQALLQWEMQNGKVDGIKTFATNTMPVVQTHLKLSQTYLAEHNLTPYTATADQQAAPGGAPNALPSGGGTVNNPAAPGGRGSTSGQEGGAGGTSRNPITPETPGSMTGGSGTMPPVTPRPAPSST